MNRSPFARSIAYAVGILMLTGCARQPRDPGLGIEYEAISLLGDTLRRPVLDSAARARMQSQLAAARVDLAARPNDPDAWIWVGRRLAYLGRYADAIATFSDGARRFPKDPRMYRHRGHRYISVRQLDKAIADLERAAELMAGRPDEVEPDGQPNARNIPIGSLQSNVWYHLALAHYLKGDWDAAARAAQSGLRVSTNPDRLVSQTHWLYMALRRAARNTDATAALAPIRDDFDIIENHSYYRLVKLYKSGVPQSIVDSVLTSIAANPSDASFAYGIANWVLYNGDTARAVRAFEQLLKGDSWASFGYIAAEADLARLRALRRASAPTDLRRLIQLEGDIDFATGDVSPDGRYVSEIDWDSGDVRLIDLRTGETRGVTGEGYEGGGYAWTSVFSRDGKRLAVAWYRDAHGRHELRVASRDGSGARTLVPASDSIQYIDPLDWTPGDDHVLVAVRQEDLVWRLGLVRVNDGSLRIIKTLSWLAPGGEQTYPRAQISPDGRFIAYDYRPDVERHGRDLYVLAIDGSVDTALLADGADDRVLGWLPNGAGLLFYSDRGGSAGVWMLPVRDGRASGAPRPVRKGVEGLIPLGVTSAGYVFGGVAASQQIHTGAIDPEAGRVVTVPRAVDDPPSRPSLAGDWSPDGTRLIYATQDPMPSRTETLVTRSAAGELVREIVLEPSFHTSTGTLSWIAEDRVVLFGSERGRFGVHELDPRTGRSKRLPVNGEGLEGGNLKWTEVSPDGRTLYVFRPPAGGGRSNQLLAIDAATGKQRVLGTFDADPRTLAVSPDGRQIALIVRDRAARAVELRVIPATGDSAHRVILRSTERPGPTSPVAWTADGTRIVYGVPSASGARVLWSVRSDGTGTPLLIGGEEWCCLGHDLRFHPDGRRIAFPAGRPRAEVWLLTW